MNESTVSDNLSGQSDGQDLESFSNLVAKNVDVVYALAFAGLGDRESAEDLACDVFLRAWLNRNHPSRTYPTSAWIAGLVRGLAREWAATGQIRSSLPGLLRLGPPAPNADEPLGAQEKLAAGTARRQLERQIRMLTVPAREVVMLRLAAGRNNEDAAQLLRLANSAVESLLKDAKAVLSAQPRVTGSPARLLGAEDALVRRILETLEAAEKSADTTRELLVKAASIDSLTKKHGNPAGNALGKGLALLGGIILYPFRLVFGSLYQLLGSRGTGLFLAMSFLAIMTLYIASLLGVIPAGMFPFAGPTPPATVLQMRPYVYNGMNHRKDVDRRSLLAEAAKESSGELVAYVPKDYGVLIAVCWKDGRTHLTGTFTGKADVIGVASIQQDPESLELAVQSPDRLNQPYTAWFLITY